MGINWTNVTDFTEFPSLANDASGGTFWVGMLYMIWIILIILLVSFGFEAAIIVASFLSLIIGLFLVYADLVNFTYVLTFVGVLLVMFLYIAWSSDRK
jgi:hypothetical protein